MGEEMQQEIEHALAEQRSRLDQFRTWEQELPVLKDLESDLEVEQISADVALESASSKHRFGIGPERAAALAGALARKGELESTIDRTQGMRKGGQADPASELERLRAGRNALAAWLEAPRSVAKWRRPRVASGVLFIACVAIVWAAIVVHLILLVVLVPLGAAMGYLTFTGQDAGWVRIGAVRSFGATSLKPPATWKTDTVRARISELDEALAGLSEAMETSGTSMESKENHEVGNDEAAATEVTLALELVEVNERIDSLLAEAGLDPGHISDEMARWLHLVHETRRIRGDLDEVRAKRKALNRETEEARDAVFRFLALKDEAPPGGRADTDALDAGLKRVAARLARG
jgi:hypothetical protein